jgi:hypothetical protein
MRRRARGFVQRGLAVLFATVFKALQSGRKDMREASKRSPADLEAGMSTLHSAIRARGVPYDDHAVQKLRVTSFPTHRGRRRADGAVREGARGGKGSSLPASRLGS